jgi:glutamate dehydrogenase (NAD(P)+)
VSYLEWVQNLERIMWTETEVNDMLQKKITGAFKDVHAASQKHGTDMRTAAMIVAVGRVAEAVKILGTFP